MLATSSLSTSLSKILSLPSSVASSEFQGKPQPPYCRFLKTFAIETVPCNKSLESKFEDISATTLDDIFGVWSRRGRKEHERLDESGQSEEEMHTNDSMSLVKVRKKCTRTTR
jgi:hypothetical protein